ncbi:MAG TPA: hypothetical protein VG963_08030, partial [Polyangiaceae bacterium]|nr:hypothetical protein [Polyangiaceae bacterium]
QMPPAAAANADCPTQFFCDGFENVAAGAGSAPATSLWQVIDSYTPTPQSDNVQISTANAHSGKQAVRISSTGSRTGIQAVLPQNTFFMRAWLQVDAVPRGPVLIGLGTDQHAETRLRIFNQSWATINAVPGDGVEPNGATSGNCPDCVTLVTNRWFCAEMGIDSNAKTATLWIDGVQAATLPNDPSQPDKPNMFIGNMALEGGQTGVLIDDVVAGPTRIGCN